MANLAPLFTTAPRLKLRINDKVVAYAVGFNVNISVDVKPIYVIGQYAPVALEPTMYNTVTGTFQIVRLLSSPSRAAVQALGNGNKNASLTGAQASTTSDITFDATSAEGRTQVAPTGSGITASNSTLGQEELFRHLNPAELLVSRSFDVVVYMKVPKPGKPSANGVQIYEEKAWMTIKDCRITSRSTNIAMGQIVNEPLSFQGLLASPSNAAGDPTFSLDSRVKQTVS